MERRFLGTICALVVAASAAHAQDGAPASFAAAEGTYYAVRSDGGEADARALALEMDRRFRIYARLFRFEAETLPEKLRVISFGDKAAYDEYVGRRLGSSRDGAVYLHYSRREGRELVLHRGAADSGGAFAHQAAVQYLRSFVANPPAWMREGFAIFFSGLGYDPARDELLYEENLTWLDTVKGWGAAAPALEAVAASDLGMQVDQDKLQVASWALVSFLLNSENEDYRRNLFEAFMVLKGDATAADNSAAVLRRVGPWIEAEALAADYRAYFDSRKTFTELVESGREAYGTKDSSRAELLFLSALDLRPTHYAPYYYLGLLAYERREYDLAENHYRSALQYGADAALVNYALGLNAAGAGREEDAKAYLDKASAASPERYRARVEELLPRLKDMKR